MIESKEGAAKEYFVHDESECEDILLLAICNIGRCLLILAAFGMHTCLVLLVHLWGSIGESKAWRVICMNDRLLFGQSSRWYAYPKSMILGMSCLLTITLAGFRSRCTIQRLIKNRMPRTRLDMRQSLVRMENVCLCRRAKWSSGSPLTYSISKYWLSSDWSFVPQYFGRKRQQLPCILPTSFFSCSSFSLRRYSRPPLSTFSAIQRQLLSSGRRQTEKSWEETKESKALARQMRLEPPSAIGLAVLSFSSTSTVLKTKSSILRQPAAEVWKTALNLCLSVSLRCARLFLSQCEAASFWGLANSPSTVRSIAFSVIIPSSNIRSCRRCCLRTAWLCLNCMRSSAKSRSASVCISFVSVRSSCSWPSRSAVRAGGGRKWLRSECRWQIFLWISRLQISIQGRLRTGTAGRSSLRDKQTRRPRTKKTASLPEENWALTRSFTVSLSNIYELQQLIPSPPIWQTSTVSPPKTRSAVIRRRQSLLLQ